ncbi:MAG: hypothetical protein IKU60_05855 [Clostridia bacterium]|nr:hypothetical protein [Clostridia bacterium]
MKKVAFILAIIMVLSVCPTISFAETEYKLRDVNDGGYAEVAMDVYQTYETEHFQIFWDTDGANSSKVTDTFLKKCETVLENCWNLFIDKMGMEPTSTSVNWNGDKTTQYKTNVILMGTGVTHYDLGANDWGAYGSVDSAGYPYFMCCLAAMDSPTVVAHEFGHAVHYAQGDNAWKDNIFLGPWFEAVANWFAEQYIYEYMPGSTQLSQLYLRETSLTKMNGRGYYEAWPILQYLTEDPDNTGVYGEKFVQKLLSTNLGSTNVLFWEVLESANGNLTTADTVGMYASHIATMDFENKALYNRYINNFINGHYFFWQQRYCMLEPLGEEVNTYAVPFERAPQGMGYNITPLDFTPGEVKVKLNALTDVAGADWRARLVKESNGTTSYSGLFSDGEEMTITVASGDNLYLSVAATPELSTMSRHTITGWAEHSKESKFPYENKTQYPYSVTLTNATPTKRPGYGGLKQHPNGGGWISYNAKVADTAYVGPNALVLDNATVGGNAVVDGYAIVAQNAKVLGNAYVGDTAMLFDRAEVSGNARVIENACLYVDYKVSGNAVVKGQALGLYNGTVTGESIIYGDWYEDEGHDITGGRFSGWHSITTDGNYATKNGDYYTRDYIQGLRTRYEFNSNLRDTYGYTDLYSVGNPVLDSDTVTFNGDNYAVLDDSVLYYDDMKITLKAKGEGEVLNIGDGIVLTLGDEAVLNVDGKTVALAANEDWNNIEIDFNNGMVTLSVNGTQKSEKCSITPIKATRDGENYIGNGFDGSVDYLHIFDLGTYVEENTIDYERLYTVLDSSYTNAFDAWSTASTNVSFDNGLHITGNTTVTIESNNCKANLFVIEFTPSGGKAYPDHGMLDTDGTVLFAHRYATDANTIYIGRGETNSAIRGTSSVADTCEQQRLTNFVAEKIEGASIRFDRGAVGYSSGDIVRIVAENTTWTQELAEKFADSENYTNNLSSMAEGEDVYTVTYYKETDGFEVKISESVYKGHFEGFGGFKVAGGANGVTVSYNNLKLYTDNAEAKIACESMMIKSEGFEGDGVAIFATDDGDVYTKNISDDFEIDIPEGFENSTFMLWTTLGDMIPLIKSYKVQAESVFTASVGQKEGAFFEITAKDDAATYTFDFVDNGSNDSGIMIGNREYLNTSSSNYFASGSIVILFADGQIYTRDTTAKTLRTTYPVGERVKVKIEADTEANTYDLYINNELVAENVSFRQGTDVLDALCLVENKGGEAFEVYNFRVK